MDRLEDYIRKNREGLDNLTPPPGTWRKIRKNLHVRQPVYLRLLEAAAFIVVILASAAFLLAKNRAGNNAAAGLRNLNETEIYYNNLANSLYREAKPLLSVYPGAQQELTDDIACLDSMCLSIKKDLKDNVANEEVIMALIRNYRMKITILEEMLEVLKEDDNNPDKNINHGL